MKLNKYQKKWVKALRSGKYKQGKRNLAKINKAGEKTYCCLGVLCEVLKKEFDLNLTKEIGLNAGLISYNGETATLPENVMIELDLISEDGSLKKGVKIGKKYHHSLISINDTSRADFNKIADLIESRPELVFNGKD